MIGDDLAGQNGPLFRPEIYRAIIKPRQKQLVQYIRSRTKAKIWYHTCGSCISYIPDLIDNGVDILNPVQVSAKDMDPSALKTHFGDRLVFWGGSIDSQKVLPSASPETVREHVRRNLAAFKPHGGYVFNNVHNIQAGVPSEKHRRAIRCGVRIWILRIGSCNELCDVNNGRKVQRGTAEKNGLKMQRSYPPSCDL